MLVHCATIAGVYELRSELRNAEFAFSASIRFHCLLGKLCLLLKLSSLTVPALVRVTQCSHKICQWSDQKVRRK